MRFNILAAVGLTLLAVGGLYAKDDSDAWAQYNHLKDDSDAYVGEGIAKLSEFDGDAERATAAARQRAKADLAGAIKVHVSSETTESIKSDKKGMSEELSSKSKESSDLSIENVKLREFPGLPSTGKVTVLAYITKADYRRQLAGKAIPLYRPKFGVGLSLITLMLDQDPDSAFAGGAQAIGLDVQWLNWVFGLETDVTMHGQEGGGTSRVSASMGYLSVGYDWTPWARRFQLFVPFRAKGGILEENFTAGPAGVTKGSGGYNFYYGLAIGLGLRFWPNDSISVDLTGLWNQGLNTAKPDLSGPSTLHPVTISGAEAKLGVSWCGF